MKFNFNSTVTINEKTYNGKNVNIINGKVIIDGVTQDDLGGQQVINITVNGNCGDIENDQGDITVNGTAGDVRTGQGNIRIGGDAKSGQGNISCRDVKGSAKTGMGNITGLTKQ